MVEGQKLINKTNICRRSEGDHIASNHELKRSDGLEEELRMLYGYGAGAKVIRWLGGRAKDVIWLRSRS